MPTARFHAERAAARYHLLSASWRTEVAGRRALWAAYLTRWQHGDLDVIDSACDIRTQLVSCTQLGRRLTASNVDER